MAVKIYTTTACTECKKVKEFFNANKIEYIEINIENNQSAAKEMITKSGQLSVPVVDFNGNIIVGFNKNKLTEAFKHESL